MGVVDFVLRRRAQKRQAEAQAAAADPELRKKVDLLESMYQKIFEYQELDAAQKADLQQQLRRQEVVNESKDRELKELRIAHADLSEKYGSLRGHHEVVQQGHKDQGIRLGQVEHEVSNLTKQAAQVPPLRAHVFKLQSFLSLYHQWGQQLVAILVANNLPVIEPPPVDLKQIEEQTIKLSNIDGSSE